MAHKLYGFGYTAITDGERFEERYLVYASSEAVARSVAKEAFEDRDYSKSNILTVAGIESEQELLAWTYAKDTEEIRFKFAEVWEEFPSAWSNHSYNEINVTDILNELKEKWRLRENDELGKTLTLSMELEMA